MFRRRARAEAQSPPSSHPTSVASARFQVLNVTSTQAGVGKDVSTAAIPPAVPAKDFTPTSPASIHDAQSRQTPSATGKIDVKACQPLNQSKLIKRSHRPSELQLQSSNGFSAANNATLKQQIWESSSPDQEHNTIVQVPVDSRAPLPPTPTSPFVMGNNGSIAAMPPSTDHPTIPTYRPARPAMRDVADVAYKRVDSVSPVSREVLAKAPTSNRSQRQASYPSRHDSLPAVDNRSRPAYADQGARDSASPSDTHSVSTVTMTEARAERALSNASTIANNKKSANARTQKQENSRPETDTPHRNVSSSTHIQSRTSALLPTPPGLPEDSPHKYGLIDPVNEPQRSSTARTRPRANSGNQLFNDVQSLQAVAAFLRANDNAEPKPAPTTNQEASTDTSRPLSAPTDSADLMSTLTMRSPEDQANATGPSPWRNFKSSGFAYARPMTDLQLNCYIHHAHLLPTKNVYAPVECGICHADDNAEHWTCSWCALRMCAECRKEVLDKEFGSLKEGNRAAALRVVPPAEYVEV